MMMMMILFLLLSFSISFSFLPYFFLPSLLLSFEQKRLCWTTSYDLMTGVHFLSVEELLLPYIVKLHTPRGTGRCLLGYIGQFLQSEGFRVRPKDSRSGGRIERQKNFHNGSAGMWTRSAGFGIEKNPFWYNILSAARYVASDAAKSFPSVSQSFTKVRKLCRE